MKKNVSLTTGAFLMLLAAHGVAADGVGLKPLECPPDSTLSAHNIKCKIGRVNGTQYRELDARVEDLRRRLYTTAPNSTLVTVTINPTSTPAEIADAVGRLQTGNHLVLANGTYNDLKLHVEGKSEVTIRPQSPRGVSLKGRTEIVLRGEKIILADLAISDGQYTATAAELEGINDCPAPDEKPKFGIDVIKLGYSGNNDCNACLAVNLHMWNLTSSSPKIKLSYLGATGNGITVAYSSFKDTTAPGHFIYASQPTKNGQPQRLHIYRNHFYHRRHMNDCNGYELIQLGAGEVQAESMFGRLEENLFQDSWVPNDETELIAVKSSDWIIRNNTFLYTIGSVSLRSADRVLVEGNFFLGGDAGYAYASGVRLEGASHWVVGNYFYRNAEPSPTWEIDSYSARYYHSIMVPSGTAEAVANNEDGDARPKDSVIANNTFAYGAFNVQLGTFYDFALQFQHPLLPQRVLFANNLFHTTSALTIFNLPNIPDSATNQAFLQNNFIESNYISGPHTGLPDYYTGPNMFSGIVPHFDGYAYLPSNEGIGAGETLAAFPVVREGPVDLGAFQSRTPYRRPLAWGDVGYDARLNRTNYLKNTEAFDQSPWLRRGLGGFSGSLGPPGSRVNSSEAAAPDGSFNAELLREEKSKDTHVHSVEQTVDVENAADTYTFSVYLKRRALNNAMVLLGTPNTPNAIVVRVDLGGGTASAYANGDGQVGSHFVQPLANDWFRVAITGKPSQAGGSQLRAVVYMLKCAKADCEGDRVEDDQDSYAGDGVSGNYLWGAQLEKDNVATVLESNVTK